MSIPKNANFIWLQGSDQIPSKYLPNLDQTARLNPDWKILVWDDKSIRTLLKSIGQKYLDKYDSFKILHQRVDFSRYAIMYAGGGGISIDVDAKAVKSFNEIPFIREKDFIVGYGNMDAVGDFVHGNHRRTINNSVIIAKPFHPILKEVLDYILTLDCREGQSDFSCVIFTTGQSFNEVLYRHKGEIVVLENDYFEGCHVNDSGCKFNPDKAIIEHRHAQSWVPEGKQKLAKIYYKMKENRMAIFTALGIIILFFIITSKTQTT